MYLLIWLMVLHFIADFILQSREMGQKKSSEVKWLLKHLGIQFAVFYVGVIPYVLLRYVDSVAMNPLLSSYPISFVVVAACLRVFEFVLFNTLIHGLIDWNIWKLYKLSAHYRIKKNAAQYGNPQESYDLMVKSWKYWEDHLFYTTIGFDQLLHVSTLIALTWWLL